MCNTCIVIENENVDEHEVGEGSTDTRMRYGDIPQMCEFLCVCLVTLSGENNVAIEVENGR